MSRVLLYSGGMDSVALRMLWTPDVSVYVDMGTGYTAAERKRLPDDVVVVDLPLGRWERPDGIIPLRNLMLVCVAAQYGNDIAMAATAGDRVLDKSERFAAMTTDLLTYLWSPQHWTDGEPRNVVLPLKGLTKREIVEVIEARHGDTGLAALAASWSCYGTGETECGACKPCFRKWVAFAAQKHGEMVVSARAYTVEHILPVIAAGQFGRRREELDVLAAFGISDPENEMEAAAWLLRKEP